MGFRAHLRGGGRGFEFLISGLELRVSGFISWLLVVGCWFGFQVPGFGFRFSGSGFGFLCVSTFGFWGWISLLISGFGFRVDLRGPLDGSKGGAAPRLGRALLGGIVGAIH